MVRDPVNESEHSPRPEGELETVERIIAAFLGSRQPKWREAVEELCHDHPEHASTIRKRLGDLSKLGLLDEYSSKDPLSFSFEKENDNKLGPYNIKRELGRGGQGEVYLADDTRLGREVALKVLRSFGTISKELIARFTREAQVAAKLNHPNICQVHEASVENGVPYIAMQLIDGDPLDRVVSAARDEGSETGFACVQFEAADTDGGARFTPKADVKPRILQPPNRALTRKLIEFFEKAARTLHAAHEAGIVHRDIKPGNIMIRPGGDPVILDFGLARDMDSELATLTRTGDLFGTPAYMSPEQITRGTIPLDRRTDIWSLGATMYECFTLRRPFEAPTREALYQAIHSQAPMPARRRNKAIPRELEVVLSTTLSKDRDRRYQSGLDLAKDLRRILESRPIRARPTSLWLRARQWARRNPWQARSQAAVIFLMVMLGVQAEMSSADSSQARNLISRLERNLDELDGSTRQAERLVLKVQGMQHDGTHKGQVERELSGLLRILKEALHK